MSKFEGMNGQWLGTYAGSSGGKIIVNVDELELNYIGLAYLFNDNHTLPNSAASFSTPDKQRQFQFRTAILAIDPASGNAVPWENVAAQYPGVAFSKYADITGTCDKDALTLSWVTDTGVTGSCALPRSKADKPSELVALNQDWGTYKEYVSGLTSKRHLFRGQSKSWRLRTSFHRTGRAEMHRFVLQDIPTLHRQLSARTKHLFDLSIPDQNGAFFNLIRHHGYPTPLLDWTYSPYAAAFFAYRGMTNEEADAANPMDKVRIFVFDQAQWKNDLPQVPMVILPGLNLSVCEFIAIENERMIPQQSASTVTNIDDIETYIKSMESESKKNYLWAIDLPKTERRRVVQELSYMGITAGSLFPGLDGACEELKERNFEI